MSLPKNISDYGLASLDVLVFSKSVPNVTLQIQYQTLHSYSHNTHLSLFQMWDCLQNLPHTKCYASKISRQVNIKSYNRYSKIKITLNSISSVVRSFRHLNFIQRVDANMLSLNEEIVNKPSFDIGTG